MFRLSGTPTLFSPGSKKVLKLPLREALAHKDSSIQAEHLLLGILRGVDPAAVGLITEHVDAGQLRSEIVTLLEQAA